MTGSASPFAAAGCDLGCCRLAPLDAGRDGAAIAAVLAGLSPWRELGYAAAGLAAYLGRADPALHRFRIDAAGAGCGVLCVRHPWLRGPYIELVCVFPGHQGRGIGDAVVSWLEVGCGPTDRNLWALVSAGNAGARRFYARCGFGEVAPLADLVRTGCDEILLRKRVGEPG